MFVPYPTHVSRLEVPFTGLANGQTRVGELDIEGMLESRWCKVQNVLK